MGEDVDLCFLYFLANLDCHSDILLSPGYNSIRGRCSSRDDPKEFQMGEFAPTTDCSAVVFGYALRPSLFARILDTSSVQNCLQIHAKGRESG